MYTEYQKYLISIILAKDFSARKSQGVIKEFLNSLTSSIYEIHVCNKMDLTPTFVYKFLKSKHKVFEKISYNYFYRWYKDFKKLNLNKNLLEYRMNYFKNIECILSIPNRTIDMTPISSKHQPSKNIVDVSDDSFFIENKD